MNSDTLCLGAHMSIAGGIPLAVERASRVGCRALQIFVKNASQWKGKVLSENEVHDFQTARRSSHLLHVVAHDSYLINLASPEEQLWERSIESLLDELDRSERLGLSHLVTHPGAHRQMGEEWGVGRIAEAINQIHDRVGDWSVQIALETTAGQGTSIGCRFEHLRDIISRCNYPEKVAVCMDTCHIFAAGYDIRAEKDYLRTMRQFDRIVGIEKLKIFHLNDSKRDLGSRVDRHDHIGKGKIGVSGFRWIVNDPRFAGIPKILETPKGKELKEDRRNLKLLRSLVLS